VYANLGLMATIRVTTANWDARQVLLPCLPHNNSHCLLFRITHAIRPSSCGSCKAQRYLNLSSKVIPGLGEVMLAISRTICMHRHFMPLNHKLNFNSFIVLTYLFIYLLNVIHSLNTSRNLEFYEEQYL